MHRTALALASLAAFAALPSCRTVSRGVDRAEGVAADLLLPPPEERKLGLEMAKEIEKKSKLSTDGEVVGYVRRIGDRVARASPNPDQWRFTFQVIDDPKTVNAFAIPGAHLYLYTGLLKAAKDEAEVAGVLAHEVAHVTRRHIARRMVAAYGLETVAGLALGKDPGKLSQIAAAIAVNGTLLQNSRGDESDADAVGLVAAHKAGWDPRGMPDFFRTLKARGGGLPEVLSFLSDHPSPADRISALEAIIRQKGLTGGERNPAALQAVQRRL